MRLWSVWKDGAHIGFALGDANKRTLARAMGEGFTFRVSSQPVPSHWAPKWIAVYKGSSLRGPQFGAFVNGWNIWVQWQLENTLGYGMAATREPGSRVVPYYEASR